MDTVSEYLKRLTGERTLRAAALAVEAATGRRAKAVEMAAWRGRMPGHWYIDIARLAGEAGLEAPPADLFRLRRAGAATGAAA
jgi:hypothetical protein